MYKEQENIIKEKGEDFMSYQICRYTKEQLRNNIKRMLKVHCEESLITGWLPKTVALETILYYQFCSEGWNEKNNCPSTNYTDEEFYGIRYHFYSASNMDVIYNPMKKEEALTICEKILNNMAEQNLVIFSQSGKAIKCLY